MHVVADELELTSIQGSTPPPLLQLAGHPVRWRLLGELARSDLMVHELTQLVGQPQSLVSYHLAKLRASNMVSAQRSSADGRDTYYSVSLPYLSAMLSATGGALHPGLRLTSPPPAARRAQTPGRVLFLCTGNSARSQMAEALTRLRSGGRVHANSAGSKPKPVHPNAVRVMRDDFGIDLSNCRSKHMSTFAGERFDRVVSLCDRVREVCPDFLGDPAPTHWSIADPSLAQRDDNEAASYAAFQHTAATLDSRVGFLLAALADRSAPVPNAAPEEQP